MTNEKSRQLEGDELIEYERKLFADPLLWRQYVMDEQAHYGYLANLKYEREEGRKEGRRIAATKIAKKIRAEGLMTDEELAEVVGLPLEVVKDL